MTDLRVGDKVRPVGTVNQIVRYFGKVTYISDDGTWCELLTDRGSRTRVKTSAVYSDGEHGERERQTINRKRRERERAVVSHDAYADVETRRGRPVLS